MTMGPEPMIITLLKSSRFAMIATDQILCS